MKTRSVFAPDHGVYLMDASRWYIARVVEEFNVRGGLPTAVDVEKMVRGRRYLGIVDFWIGFRSIASVLNDHARFGYYEITCDSEGYERFRVLPEALEITAEYESDPRYWGEFFLISAQ